MMTTTTTTRTGGATNTLEEAGIQVFRAVASLVVVGFHAFLYWAAAGDTTEDLEYKVDLVNTNMGLKLLSFANLSVDGFLVLSGYLAWRASSCETSQPFSLTAYIGKKVRRILVPYWATLAAVAAMARLPLVAPGVRFDPIFNPKYCPRTLVLSPLLLNNWIGFGGCGVHLWSVAVQVHLFVFFGLACKLLMAKVVNTTGEDGKNKGYKGYKGYKATVAVIAVLSLLRVALATHFGSRFPPPPFDHQSASQAMQDAAMYYYHVLYFATPSRATNFVSGILLALVLGGDQHGRDQHGRDQHGHDPWTPRAAKLLMLVTLSVTVAYVALLTSVDYRKPGDWKPWLAALLFHGSPLASLVMALLLATAIVHWRRKEHEREKCTNIGSRAIRWLSDRSYLVYLWHPVAMRLVLALHE